MDKQPQTRSTWRLVFLGLKPELIVLQPLTQLPQLILAPASLATPQVPLVFMSWSHSGFHGKMGMQNSRCLQESCCKTCVLCCLNERGVVTSPWAHWAGDSQQSSSVLPLQASTWHMLSTAVFFLCRMTPILTSSFPPEQLDSAFCFRKIIVSTVSN